MDRFLFRLGWLLANNNGRCIALWAVTAALFIAAIWTGFGDPILSTTLTEKIKEVAQTSQYHQALYGVWNHGKEVARSHDHGLRDWSLWIWFFVALLISLIYTPIAFREEAREAWDEAVRRFRERRETEARMPKPEVIATGVSAVATTGAAAAAVPLGGGFWTLLRRLIPIEIIAEFIGIFVQKIFRI